MVKKKLADVVFQERYDILFSSKLSKKIPVMKSSLAAILAFETSRPARKTSLSQFSQASLKSNPFFFIISFDI